MSDYIDTFEGWRERTIDEPYPSHTPRLVEYDENNRTTRVWVREAPVPPLPAAPYTVIRVEWSPSYGRTEPSILVKQNEHGWYGDGYAGVPEVLRRDIASFEVLSEPGPVIAKAVLGRLLNRLDAEGIKVPNIGEWIDMVGREFGVES